jgi:hypothetical protein
MNYLSLKKLLNKKVTNVNLHTHTHTHTHTHIYIYIFTYVLRNTHSNLCNNYGIIDVC